MTNRHYALLQGLVEEHTRTAKPVSSTQLAELLMLAVSPATIRSALRDLELEGYITQPHTSAGRVPTDRGYRWYVDRVLVGEIAPWQTKYLAEQFKQLQEEHGRLSRATAILLSRLTRSMAVSGWLSSRDIQEAGLASLLSEPSDDALDQVKEISNFLDRVESNLGELSSLDDHKTSVFIGEENPLFKAKHTSLLVRTVNLDDEKVVLAIIGPKRMKYDRNVSLLESVAGLFESKDD